MNDFYEEPDWAIAAQIEAEGAWLRHSESQGEDSERELLLQSQDPRNSPEDEYWDNKKDDKEAS